MSRSSLMGPGPWQRESQGKSERLRGLRCNEFRESPQWASPPWMGFASGCQLGGCIHREANRVNMGRHSSNYQTLPSEKKVEERKQKIAESMKPQDGKGECERECVQGQISHPQSHVLFTSVRLCLTSDYILPRETIKSFCQRLFNRNATLNHSLSLSHLTSGNCTAGRMSTDGFSIYQSNVLEISTHTWMNSDCYLFKCYGKQVSIIHMINLS